MTITSTDRDGSGAAGPTAPTETATQLRLSSMVERVRDYAIFLLDTSGRVMSWNVGAERFKGWQAAEIIGRHFSVFHPPEDVDAGKLEMELEVAAREGRFEEEGWRVRKDGSRFWANVVITAVRSEDGELLGYGKVTRDVTQRHVAEVALRQSEARFRSVTESATDAIISTDADGRITAWNPAATRLFGYSAAEAIGESLTFLAPLRHRARTRAILERSLAHDDGDAPAAGAVELVVQRKDGIELPVEISIGSWDLDGERNFCGIMRDISERKRIEGQLQYLADHDSLTGLYNRRRFEAELRRVVSETSRYDRMAALLVLDLDGFKQINDRHGHPAGDEIIAKVGGILAGIMRESDIVARLGGDEFGIVLLEADRERAEEVAAKVIHAICDRGLVVGGLIRAQLTASVGITLIEGDQFTAEDLLVEADRAMYAAKYQGRSRHAVHVREAGAGLVLAERQSWLERLRRAIDDDLFELHAQPIVGICGDGVPRYELLLRMRGDDGELMTPDAFLSNAERFDLIGGIDRWVLRQAVVLLHDQIAAGNDISLTVNLSGKTMNDLSIAEDLAAMMAAHPIPEGRLVVEVTETAAIVNIARAGDLARDLRALGCLFALDDFGSGFASFYYLKHLEFDYLKIDGEFISKLPETTADQLVVRAVVDIARGLGTKTIAEFVGDDATVALLEQLGVDYGQGYHLGRPAPLEERFPATLAA